MQEMSVQSLGLEDPLEDETATHLSILARKTLYPEELQSIGSQSDTATHAPYNLI